MASSIVSPSTNGGASAEPHSMFKIPKLLPHELSFSIRVGSEQFYLSGTSLSSDGPSFFTHSFQAQIREAEAKGLDPQGAMRTLNVDRDPVTFRDISLHLQGYRVRPRDGTHFVRLFADAQFYGLRNLISQLHEEDIFISIGGRDFQIPRDLYRTLGNSDNYFTLLMGSFFPRPDNAFPGLDCRGLIRPPSILPPSVPNRDADIFAELLRLLRGYPVPIRDEAHRRELLRDARHFSFRGVEQQLLPHAIGYNRQRQREEIAMRLETVRKSGVSIAREADADPRAAWLTYTRPFLDDIPRELVLEIGGETTKIHFSDGSPKAEFLGVSKEKITRLFAHIATKLNLPPTTQPLGLLMASGGAGSQPATPGHTPLSQDLVQVIFDSASAITLDGKDYDYEDSTMTSEVDTPSGSTSETHANPRKRRRIDSNAAEEWIVKTGQWRLRIQSSKGGKSAVECVLVAIKLDAASSELALNRARSFLGS